MHYLKFLCANLNLVSEKKVYANSTVRIKGLSKKFRLTYAKY